MEGRKERGAGGEIKRKRKGGYVRQGWNKNEKGGS